MADDAIARLRPHGARAFEETLTRAAWETVPSLFVLPTEDRIFAEPLKATGVRADVRVTIPGSHSPFLSRPAELADTLEKHCVSAG